MRGEPQLGIVTVGRFPLGQDDVTAQVTADLNRAGYLAEASDDIHEDTSVAILGRAAFDRWKTSGNDRSAPNLWILKTA